MSDKCPKCGYYMCLCECGRTPRKPPPTVLQESAAASCLPATVINVEFRSDARRIADLEGRVAELEVCHVDDLKMLEAHIAELEARFERHAHRLPDTNCLIT